MTDQIFHLAIKVKNLEVSKKFFNEVLDCEIGRSQDEWCDINFFGHELTLHEFKDFQQEKKAVNKMVDMIDTPVPHFGAHLKRNLYNQLEKKLLKSDVEFLSQPLVRFKDEPHEQKTMFFYIPDNYIIELKSMDNPATLFPKKFDGNTYRPLPNYLTIKQSHIEGLGLFATKDIPAKTFIGETHYKINANDKGWVRTPLGGFINHADKPNSKIKSVGDVTRCLVTKEDIAKGTEITVFYTLY